MDQQLINLALSAGAGAFSLEIARQLYRAYIGRVVDKNAQALSNLPELYLHFEYMKTAITKIELQLEILSKKKDETRERLIEVESKARAAHRRLDDLVKDL